MSAITEVKIYKSPKKVNKALAKEFHNMTLNSKQPRFDLALSGGNSPLGLFDRIAEKYVDKINWDRIHLWWGDERCVSPDNNASNSSCKDTGLPEGLKSFLNPDITFPLVVAIPGATPVSM